MNRIVLLALLSMASTAAAQSSLSESRSYESEPQVQTRLPVVADVVAKPDALLLTFTVRAENPDPERALYTCHVAFDEVSKRLSAALPGAQLKAENFGAQAAGWRKSTGSESLSVSVEGDVTVPLPDSDFWTRANVVAQLHKIADELAINARNNNTGYTLGFSQPTPRLRDPEKFRAELEKKLTMRAKDFAAAASTPGHTLMPASCTVPGAVNQQAISQEEVALSIQASCMLQLPAGK
ncbi:MAG: hypothetical protein JST54_31820 [Deltaproteobacteria bacterium]|nr:hypothetical protein [Deltaproteobacteria bacterium]